MGVLRRRNRIFPLNISKLGSRFDHVVLDGSERCNVGALLNGESAR